MLAAGWGLGFLLAAPHILPVLEYSQTGARVARRSAGAEERPPAGLAALPQAVLPDMYGVMKTGSLYLVNASNQAESTAAAYTGVLATLCVAPLAWCSRRRRAGSVFWACLAFLGLSWCLNVPGIVTLLRLPGLNLMSHNRLVFIASFAILTMMVIGLEVLLQGLIQWHGWFWLPLATLAGLFLWCAFRAMFLPEPVDTQIEAAILQGHHIQWIRNLEGVRRAQEWFARYYAEAAVWCGLGVGWWWLLWFRRTWQARLFPVLAALLVGDLLWFAFGKSVQCDPALNFPPIPVLEQIAKAAPGRVIGFSCLPASLTAMSGLRDIRGFDGVDPARLIELVTTTADPRSPVFPYALTQFLAPKLTFTPEGGIRLSPLLDMLGVRYVILRSSPPPGIRPAFQGLDYWVMANATALPRAFVPRRVEWVAEDKARLQKLLSPQFDPREVAYVETPVNLPGSSRGHAEIGDEIPTRVRVSVQMETPGLVVLADLWDKGWQAYLSGKPVPILRTNHAIRGVVVPAGSGTLEFRYEPASFSWGLRLAGLAALVILGWLVGIAVNFRKRCVAAV
jgi:hypothetical protein